jgi:hypothetical protein
MASHCACVLISLLVLDAEVCHYKYTAHVSDVTRWAIYVIPVVLKRVKISSVR